MKRNTAYQEQILFYLNRNEDYSSLIDWIADQPLLDQPDILRQLTAFLKERHEKTGEKDYLEKANLIEKGIDQYEEDILDYKLVDNLILSQVRELEANEEKLEEFFNTIRNSLIKIILSDSIDDKEYFWDLVFKLINAEKESNLYFPEHWNAIF